MEQRIEIILRRIADDPCRETSLTELARHVNLSPQRLSHLFKSETGVSLSQHLKATRLEKAKELIENSFLTIKEIRLKVGAKDKSRFAQSFREAYGLTPSQYRARVRNMARDKNR